MTDYVLKRKVFEDGLMLQRAGAFLHIIKYAEFLKRPLTLGMFVPCDENGNFLQMPKLTAVQDGHFDFDEMNEYHEAKERVLFQGFEIQKDTCNEENYYLIHEDWGMSVMNKIHGFGWQLNTGFTDVESLFLEYPEIELTEKQAEKLGLWNIE